MSSCFRTVSTGAWSLKAGRPLLVMDCLLKVIWHQMMPCHPEPHEFKGHWDGILSPKHAISDSASRSGVTRTLRAQHMRSYGKDNQRRGREPSRGDIIIVCKDHSTEDASSLQRKPLPWHWWTPAGQPCPHPVHSFPQPRTDWKTSGWRPLHCRTGTHWEAHNCQAAQWVSSSATCCACLHVMIEQRHVRTVCRVCVTVTRA